MKAPRMFVSLTAFLITAAAMQAFAGSGAQAKPKAPLPGIKSYNFSATPKVLRWRCLRLWKGRYWRQQRFYGCDEISGVPFRVTCVWRGRAAAPFCVVMRGQSGGPAGGGSHGGPRTGGNVGRFGGMLSARP